ncbi:hypothetical protein [Fibrella aquatilis]|uniref:Septum formation inhibitor Maf n=1 Tax=Fibrella aquatilis TaxID=2817059 RepID=A0A939JZ24_9BACT|nr:hypothetical protein [Fibrella aquatilis]MBO0932709.1 hypothetical protein [Fibrella aquatilis]
MFIQRNFLFIIMVMAVLLAVAMKATVYQREPVAPPTPSPATTEAFRAYWFGGKAELNTYQLEQAQYGAMHTGEAVLVFVTEDFRVDKQVKAESEASRGVSVPVLKTNYIRRFVTGIYDYSLFTSVFTPIGSPKFPNTLKVSTSGQEWCGHSYVQVNYKDNAYQVSGRSYFEQEVTEDYTVEKAMLEDELWNRIRLDPGKLPTGDVHLIPGTQSARLRHKKLESIPATATLDSAQGVAWTNTHIPGVSVGPCKAYILDYKDDGKSTPGRKLTLIFETAFPHKIVGWEETYTSKEKVLTSRAMLRKTIQSDYWNHNTPADSTLRQALSL